MLEVFAATPEDMGPGEVEAYAARVEAMGFDGLQVPDALHDGLLLAAIALRATSNLLVGTGVLVAFARSPMTVAIVSWDLQNMSWGRFELGLGTQIRQNIKQRYSARWDAPVPQLREYVQSLKAIFHSFQTGEPLCFEGAHYRFTRLQPFFNPGPIDHPDIPILCGAVGRDMTRMVARKADGMIAHPTASAPEYVREVCLPRLREGFQKEQRAGDDFRFLLGPLTATGCDEATVAREWEKQRRLLGFLFSTPAYWPSLDLFGWQEKGQQLGAIARSGSWQDMPGIITDEVLEKFVPRATYDTIADVYRDRFRGLSRRITFPVPEDPGQDAAAAKAVAALKAD